MSCAIRKQRTQEVREDYVEAARLELSLERSRLNQGEGHVDRTDNTAADYSS